jgi:hypothetical protein
MRFKHFLIAASIATAAIVVLLHELSLPSADSLTGTAERLNDAIKMLHLPATSGREVDHEVFEQLADDPRAALEQLLQSSGRNQRALLCADPHFRSAVTAAANRLMQMTRLKSDGGPSPALENFVQLWSAVDLTSASQWVHGIPAGQARNALMARLAYVESQSAPADAARRVVDEIPPGPIQEEAVAMVLHQWALRSFDDAAAWVAMFPEGKTRERAINELDGIRDYSLAEVPQ